MRVSWGACVFLFLLLSVVGCACASEDDGLHYEIDVDDLLPDRPELLMLYFSASWCSSCVDFSPKVVDLASQIESSPGDSKSASLLLLSRERNAKRHAHSMKKFAFPAVPYLDARREAFNELFSVGVIPTIVVLQRDADQLSSYQIIDGHGYHSVMVLGPEAALAYWRGVARGTVDRVDHKVLLEAVEKHTSSTKSFAKLKPGVKKEDL